MEAVLVALGVAALAIFGQWLLKRQDYKRLDELAQRQIEQAEKIEQVHKIVNQQRTDMQSYQAVLKAALEHAGVAVPADKSLDT
jgi:multidrug resistance efflux pump